MRPWVCTSSATSSVSGFTSGLVLSVACVKVWCSMSTVVRGNDDPTELTDPWRGVHYLVQQTDVPFFGPGGDTAAGTTAGSRAGCHSVSLPLAPNEGIIAQAKHPINTGWAWRPRRDSLRRTIALRLSRVHVRRLAEPSHSKTSEVLKTSEVSSPMERRSE